MWVVPNLPDSNTPGGSLQAGWLPVHSNTLLGIPGTTPGPGWPSRWSRLLLDMESVRYHTTIIFVY